MSLAVVCADYPNKRGLTRRFEIAVCKPGDLAAGAFIVVVPRDALSRIAASSR